MADLEYHRQWYQKNKVKRRAQLRSYDVKRYGINQRVILEYLQSHPCVDCGEGDPVVLEFDHRDRSTKTRAVSEGAIAWGEARLRVEIEKCDIRCANCHRRKTAKAGGYYRTLGL